MTTTFLDINQLTLSDWIGIISFLSGLISLVLAILFFRWGLKHEEVASRITANIEMESAKAILEIKQNIIFINRNQEKLNDSLFNTIMKQWELLTEEKLNERLKIELEKDPDKKEESLKSVKIVDKEIFEEVTNQTKKEIHSFYTKILLLAASDIGVLYSIWMLKTSNIQSIERITGFKPEIIMESINGLKIQGFLDENLNITSALSILLDGIFNVDYYSGISFQERVNSIKEVIERAIKISK